MNYFDSTGRYATSISYSAFEDGFNIIVFAEKKRNNNWVHNPNKRKNSENRQPSGERERNVKHPNGEEHSRTPKGNGPKIRHFQAIAIYNEQIHVFPADTSLHQSHIQTIPGNSFANEHLYEIAFIGVGVGLAAMVVLVQYTDTQILHITNKH